MHMTVSNELSGDIAVAMLAKETSEGKRSEIKETVLKIHSLLQELEQKARRHVAERTARTAEGIFKAGA